MHTARLRICAPSTFIDWSIPKCTFKFSRQKAPCQQIKQGLTGMLLEKMTDPQTCKMLCGAFREFYRQPSLTASFIQPWALQQIRFYRKLQDTKNTPHFPHSTWSKKNLPIGVPAAWTTEKDCWRKHSGACPENVTKTAAGKGLRKKSTQRRREGNERADQHETSKTKKAKNLLVCLCMKTTAIKPAPSAGSYFFHKWVKRMLNPYWEGIIWEKGGQFLTVTEIILWIVQCNAVCPGPAGAFLVHALHPSQSTGALVPASQRKTGRKGY